MNFLLLHQHHKFFLLLILQIVLILSCPLFFLIDYRNLVNLVFLGGYQLIPIIVVFNQAGWFSYTIDEGRLVGSQ